MGFSSSFCGESCPFLDVSASRVVGSTAFTCRRLALGSGKSARWPNTQLSIPQDPFWISSGHLVLLKYPLETWYIHRQERGRELVGCLQDGVCSQHRAIHSYEVGSCWSPIRLLRCFPAGIPASLSKVPQTHTPIVSPAERKQGSHEMMPIQLAISQVNPAAPIAFIPTLRPRYPHLAAAAAPTASDEVVCTRDESCARHFCPIKVGVSQRFLCRRTS